jgi:hypothetical protein
VHPCPGRLGHRRRDDDRRRAPARRRALDAGANIAAHPTARGGRAPAPPGTSGDASTVGRHTRPSSAIGRTRRAARLHRAALYAATSARPAQPDHGRRRHPAPFARHEPRGAAQGVRGIRVREDSVRCPHRRSFPAWRSEAVRAARSRSVRWQNARPAPWRRIGRAGAQRGDRRWTSARRAATLRPRPDRDRGSNERGIPIHAASLMGTHAKHQ